MCSGGVHHTMSPHNCNYRLSIVIDFLAGSYYCHLHHPFYLVCVKQLCHLRWLRPGDHLTKRKMCRSTHFRISRMADSWDMVSHHRSFFWHQQGKYQPRRLEPLRTSKATRNENGWGRVSRPSQPLSARHVPAQTVDIKLNVIQHDSYSFLSIVYRCLEFPALFHTRTGQGMALRLA